MTFLNPKKGVFFGHGEARLFLAYRDKKPVGRISAHINHQYERLKQDGKGFFGFFECEDSQETAGALFAGAEAYLEANGRKSCEGALSFGIYDEVGILVEGFESAPYVMNVHNPPYFGKLIA